MPIFRRAMSPVTSTTMPSECRCRMMASTMVTWPMRRLSTSVSYWTCGNVNVSPIQMQSSCAHSIWTAVVSTTDAVSHPSHSTACDDGRSPCASFSISCVKYSKSPPRNLHSNSCSHWSWVKFLRLASTSNRNPSAMASYTSRWCLLQSPYLRTSV